MGETVDSGSSDRPNLELEKRREASAAEPEATRRKEGVEPPPAPHANSQIYRIERSAIALRRWRIGPATTSEPEESLRPYVRPDAEEAGGDRAARGWSRVRGWLKTTLFGSKAKLRVAGEAQACPPPIAAVETPDLVGIALSGGGIRSASFNLGLLQGLASRNALWAFDYLSTVSGGGFVGAWWSAWLSRRKRASGIFPAAEELELRRRARTAVLRKGDDRPTPEAEKPDGSLIANERHDPIHFLRLFSNYLTPRTGAFSPDTWRLIAFFTRNLLFTWMVLLPLLLAAMMTAQAFFVSNDEVAHAFLCSVPSDPKHPPKAGTATATATATSTATVGTPAVAIATAIAPATLSAPPPALVANLSTTGSTFCQRSSPTRADSLHARATHVLLPLAILGAAYVTFALLWLAHASAGVGLTIASLAVLAVVARPAFLAGESGWSGRTWSTLGVAVGCVVFHTVQSFRGYRRSLPGRGLVSASAADHRGWLTKQQTWILRLAVCVGGLLLAAGFGHDVAAWLFSGNDSVAGRWLANSGGWGGVLLALASAVYTGIKAAPSTDGTVPPPPGRFGRVVISLAPPLVLALLIVGAAWVGHALLRFTIDRPIIDDIVDKTRLLFVASIVTCIAVFELVYAVFESFHDPAMPPTAGPFWTRFVPDWTLGRSPVAPAHRVPWFYMFSPRGWVRITAAGVLGVVLWFLPNPSWAGIMAVLSASWENVAAMTVLACAAGVTFVSRKWPIALGSARPAVLLCFASSSAALCLMARVQATGDRDPLLCALLWVAILVGGVVCIGWLVDPNLLSLHGFYKGRLSRAYLGASNTARDNEEITDAAPGDDLPLTEVWNHDAGGPYHLINTALSLVGGSDLATSQRLAENFVLSRYHCGSARAGYRCTAEYMAGEMSLATAAAISGAAISPNMGSQTPSAALSLLLSLMNLRLGFWAPTPSGRRWSEPQARLWPFYVLRETLSNTGQIGTYSYLTDGGHFDNTGLYALVERGCRFIVVSDCGADPSLGFDDIGTAIRRCRIDFGTEIELGIDGFTARKKNRTAPEHVVWGKIRYQPEHLKLLGLEGQPENGVIAWIKPCVTALNAADVRQYHRAQDDFPQQSTGDQWYDESQFESYRRLGYESARAAFAAPGLVEGAFGTIAPWFNAQAPTAVPAAGTGGAKSST